MDNALLPLAGTLVFTLVGFLQNLRAGNLNGVLTQLIAWVSGVGVILLIAQTSFATGVVLLGDVPLDKNSFADLFFMGLMASSLLGVVNTVVQAIDNNQSAAKPKLIE